jgi:hypothetical protein
MAGEDHRPIDLGVRGATRTRPDDSELDAIELGSPGLSWLSWKQWKQWGQWGQWRQWRRFRLVGLVCGALMVGALAGYVVATAGAHPAPGPTTPNGVVPTTRLLVGGPGQPPTVTGNRCSAQLGNALQVGLEIVNPSAAGTTLLGAQVDLPLAGMQLTKVTWGSCGQLSTVDGGSPYPLPAGATAWLTMTFDVQIACPAPLPVQVAVRYAQADKPSAVTPLGGFSDLGDVPYSGCTQTPG